MPRLVNGRLLDEGRCPSLHVVEQLLPVVIPPSECLEVGNEASALLPQRRQLVIAVGEGVCERDVGKSIGPGLHGDPEGGAQLRQAVLDVTHGEVRVGTQRLDEPLQAAYRHRLTNLGAGGSVAQRVGQGPRQGHAGLGRREGADPAEEVHTVPVERCQHGHRAHVGCRRDELEQVPVCLALVAPKFAQDDERPTPVGDQRLESIPQRREAGVGGAGERRQQVTDPERREVGHDVWVGEYDELEQNPRLTRHFAREEGVGGEAAFVCVVPIAIQARDPEATQVGDQGLDVRSARAGSKHRPSQERLGRDRAEALGGERCRSQLPHPASEVPRFVPRRAHRPDPNAGRPTR